jgi:pimeloyl-ACP methyl ester carboxylesterase
MVIRRQFIDIPGGQLHYRWAGEGKNLIILHQAPMSSDEYVNVIPLLAGDYRTMALDLPGHGDSFDPDHEYEIEEYAEAVIATLKKLGIRKTSLVGHHTGALIAVQVAIADPKRIDKLVLSGCPALSPEEWAPLLSRPGFRSMPATPDGKLVQFAWEVYRGMSLSPDPEIWLRYFLLGLQARFRPYDAHQAVGRYPARKRLPQVTQPVLLLSGTKDYFINDLESTRKLFPNALSEVIEGTGAFVAREDPAAFAKLILGFLGSSRQA